MKQSSTVFALVYLEVPDSLPNWFDSWSQADSLRLMTKFIWSTSSKYSNLWVMTPSVTSDMRWSDYGSTVSYPIDPETSSKPMKVINTKIPLSSGHLHLKHTYQSLLVYTVFTWEAAYSRFHLRSLSKRNHGGKQGMGKLWKYVYLIHQRFPDE